MKLGQEGSGVVVAVGENVKSVKPGDEVYGHMAGKPVIEHRMPGFASQYGVADEQFLLHKPPHVSFEEAASCLGFITTAIQTIRRGLQLRGQESLEGQTVLVPAGLSGTGAVGLQVAKNVFGAEKIITTVSTSKVPLVEQYLPPGLVDQVVDYRTQKLDEVIPPGSVDFMYNTQWTSLDSGISVLKHNTGTLMSITSIPSKGVMREIMGPAQFPWWLGVLLDLAQLYYVWKLRWTGIKYEMLSGNMQIREDLENAGEILSLGKVKPVIRLVDLEDIEALRRELGKIATGKGDEGKGGIGKLVIRIPQ